VTAPCDRLAAALADRYRIERELGAGRVATVCLGHGLRRGRPVALEVLLSEPASAASTDQERP
jgi:serine/threonine protein kinase